MLNEQFFTSSDNVTEIRFVGSVPQTPRAALVIAHGIGEYAGRYGELAVQLAEKGIAVYAIDFIGHGASISNAKAPMYFGEDGWNYLVEDLISLNKLVKRMHPNVPCFMLGFSMGSFVLRTALAEKPDEVEADGVILAGTGRISSIVASVVKKVVAAETKKNGGADVISEKVNNLAFGNYNKYFKPAKTEFDWLCKNEKALKEYIEDPFAAKFITPGMFSDLLGGIARTSKKTAIKNTKNIPILFMSGEEDPVGEFVKGVRKVVEEFRKHNSRVTFMTFSASRHDIFHDNDKLEVIDRMYCWMDEIIEK